MAKNVQPIHDKASAPNAPAKLRFGCCQRVSFQWSQLNETEKSNYG